MVADAGELALGPRALIGDGSDNLVTRHRVSPYALASAGMPLAALPAGSFALPGLVAAPTVE